MQAQRLLCTDHRNPFSLDHELHNITWNSSLLLAGYEYSNRSIYYRVVPF